MQQHRKEHDIIHGTHEWKREIDRVESVEGQEPQRWHEPGGPARMGEREPQQVKSFPTIRHSLSNRIITVSCEASLR